MADSSKCTGCARELPISEFPLIDPKRRPLARSSRCRDCRNAYCREWRAANPDRASATAKRWRAANPQRNADNQRRWYDANKSRHNARGVQNYRRWRDELPEQLMCLRAKARAKRLGLPFDLVPSDVVIPDVCPILGIPIRRTKRGRGPSWNSPSLDRIDGSKGYVKGNVQVISHRANTLKLDATVDELELVIRFLRTASV